jgi:transcriptional regulator with XRE-family HTH domain
MRERGDASALHRLRELQGLTLQEVADLAGLSKAYVARLEYGERVPERDTLIALLLASFSLPVRQANRLLFLAGYAPMHHKAIAKAA